MHIYTLTTSLEYMFDKISASNRFGGKIEESKLEIETTIEMKLDDIKDNNMKKIDSHDAETSDITSNKIYSYTENYQGFFHFQTYK